MLGVVAILFVISMFANKRYVMGTVFAGIIGILGILILSGKIEMFNYALFRLEVGAGNDLTSGRTELWSKYFAHFDENVLHWLVGSGAGAGDLGGVAAHNTYIDLIYYYGILGTGLLLVTCVIAVGGIKPRQTIVNHVPVICLVALSLFLSNLIFFDFVFCLILVICALQTDFRRPSLAS